MFPNRPGFITRPVRLCSTEDVGLRSRLLLDLVAQNLRRKLRVRGDVDPMRTAIAGLFRIARITEIKANQISWPTAGGQTNSPGIIG
jgi:hypothetical protein